MPTYTWTVDDKLLESVLLGAKLMEPFRQEGVV